MHLNPIRQRLLPQVADHDYSPGELDQFADDLREIQRTARRKRVLGRPDHVLEAGVAVLEDRLARMRREAMR